MGSKHQAIILRRQAGTLRRTLQREMKRFSPFSDRYVRLDFVLEKAEKRWQRRRKAEAEFADSSR